MYTVHAKAYIRQGAHSRALTFTGLEALEPRMIKVRVARIAAVVEPSPVAGTATESA